MAALEVQGREGGTMWSCFFDTRPVDIGGWDILKS